MMSKHRLTLLTVLLAGVAACGGTEATGPVLTTPASLTIVSGNAQVDTVGKELVEPLVVRALNAQGAPVRQHVVNFRFLSGVGSVFAGVAITDNAGEARARWTLGTVAGDTQTVEARAVDNQTGEALVFATFTAIGVPDAPDDRELTSGGAPVGGGPVRLGAIGDTLTLAAAVSDSFGNEITPQSTIQWTSSDTLTVTISAEGLVTARQLGSATITASTGSLAAITSSHPEMACWGSAAGQSEQDKHDRRTVWLEDSRCRVAK